VRKNENMIAIYSRKSKFTGKGESIGNQVELCKEYVRNMFGAEYEDRCVVFEDEGFSGGNLQRPDFKRMMEDVRKRKFKAIVVYRLDRISRNINDFTGLIDELTKLDVSFVSIKEQFDTSTPMGRAMMFIISVFSQLERETIAERIRDNMHELAKTGRWLGGTTPTGFASGAVSKITIDGRPRESVMEELRTHFHMYEFHHYVEGVSYGNDKATGMQLVLDAVGIPRERAVAVGDSANDEAMLRYAGIPVVMGDGDPKMQKIAKYVTCPCLEGGVGDIVEELVLK